MNVFSIEAVLKTFDFLMVCPIHQYALGLRKSKDVTGTRSKVFIIDELGSYPDAYEKEFWTAKRADRTSYIKYIHLQDDMNNNKMERLNDEIRDKEKIMRGLKKTNDTVLLKGYEIYHTYFRQHQALDGKTSSEKYGIKINGNNKRITLIQNASKRKLFNTFDNYSRNW